MEDERRWRINDTFCFFLYESFAMALTPLAKATRRKGEQKALEIESSSMKSFQSKFPGHRAELRGREIGSGEIYGRYLAQDITAY